MNNKGCSDCSLIEIYKKAIKEKDSLLKQKNKITLSAYGKRQLKLKFVKFDFSLN
jgi:hypothetical protein